MSRFVRGSVLLCAALIWAGCENPVRPDVPPTDLPRSTPEAQGIDSGGLLALLEAIDRENARGDLEVAPEFHSLMVLRNGHVVAEGWWDPYSAERNHVMFSLSKSFTSTAAGLAINEGFFGLDDPVLSFFPDKHPATVSDNLEAMTVRHLLSMSTGQEVDDRTTDDWVATFLSIPVVHEPGSVFRYSTSATFMVSAIVQETTGQTLMDFLTPRLFEPLGIEGVAWQTSPGGYNTGGYGLKAKTEDVAKLGQLYLEQGRWKGRPLLPDDWVQMATSKQIETRADPDNPEHADDDWAQGYGFQFWQTTHNAYRGDGAFGQFCLVIPELDLVVAITGGSGDMQAMLDLIWEHLYPAIRGSELPDNPDAHQRLLARLDGLDLMPPPIPVPGEHPAPSSFELAENALGLTRVQYTFEPLSATVRFESEAGVYSSECGYNSWLFSEASGPLLPANILSRQLADTLDVAAACQWTSTVTFEVIWRFVETPRAYVLTSTFDGDAVRIERRWHNSREPVDFAVEGARAPD